MKERPFNISLFSLHIDILIIFEKLISINEYNFKFTNIEEIVDGNSIVLIELGFQTS